LKAADHWARVVRHSPLALLLDLDGTLIPFAPQPELAGPGPALVDLLSEIASLPGLRAVVASGRPRTDLERWFGGTPNLWLAAEHGAFLRGEGAWTSTWSGRPEAIDLLCATLQTIADATDGARVERKSCTVALHYRGVEPLRRAALLVEAEAAVRVWLRAASGYDLLAGADVLEVRPFSARKAAVVEWVRRAHGADLRIVALGDDLTDEDMFGALGSSDEAVIVGKGIDRITAATWTLPGPDEATGFLSWLLAVREQKPTRARPVLPRRLRAQRRGRARRGSHELLMVSNRLPQLRAPASPGPARKTPVGGLVGALEPVVRARSGLWLGWSGRVGPSAVHAPLEVTADARSRLAWFDLPDGAYEAYYNGFCNRTLWPLLHALPERARFADSEFEAYSSINDRIAEAVRGLVSPECAVWAHDFHVLMLAAGLRRRGHRGPLGLFLHVPFPGVDTFELNPWAAQLLDGMMSFDLLGFQTDRDVRNFLHVAGAMSSASVSDDLVEDGGRRVRVRAFPIGIMPDAFEPASGDDEREETASLLRSLAGRRLILGVDRLDYTKGIPERLEAFSLLLTKFPEWRSRVSLVQVSVPSRADVLEYQEQRQRIESAVGRINGEFGEADWTPVRYLYRSYGRGEVTRLYREADLCLVTPLRDGMNLVAKEYVAAQDPERPGVLVLSRFAGAARELTDSVLTNPWHAEGLARDIDRALRMTIEERKDRHTRLLAAVHRTTAVTWAESFVQALDACRRPADIPKD
jgi:alpha,alpha-trehalose-phosphate synthase [UDP-forming]/trehalose-phosphatase